VVLADISGSMSRYTRMLLHFLHALTNDRDRVHTFVFGTRLTNVTRSCASRDPDVAVAAGGREVKDWSGGTRIGTCLHEFNRRWARRVLGQATVLLITDGLDRDGDTAKGWPSRWSACTSPAAAWCGSTRCCASTGFEPRAAASARCCRTWTLPAGA
jgi:hypothetical protein